MIIKSLKLSDFRNYKNLDMDFSSGINILYGDNAQGKTNILEAIYMSSTTRSHKGSKDKDVIRLKQEESHIRVQIEKNQIEHRIDMHLKKNKAKGIAINGVPIRKSSELIGLINVVFFSPEDLGIIKNGPGERRRFMDMELCQLDRIYLHNLSKYNKIINQRNNLLKQIGYNRELLDTLNIWDIQLLDYGSRIIKRRNTFIEELNIIVKEIHKNLTGGKEELQLRYEPNVQMEQFELKLLQLRERDLTLKMTNIGPHRDDINFLIHENDIRKYGSQGQQRTAALSLKLAEIEMVKRIIKDKPILLLDDVLSELDRKRQTYLLDNIHDIQTIVTCTGMEEFVCNRLPINQIYQVVEGTVIRKKELTPFL